MRKSSSKVIMEIKSADPIAILSRMNSLGIAAYNVVAINELTIQLCIHYRYLHQVIDEVENAGGSCEVVQKSIRWYLGRVFTKRMVLVSGLICVLALTLYLQNHILFVQVDGNDHIATNLILQEVHSFGVRFGTPRKKIRSEELKNYMIEKIPNLEWLGVNTKGCVATISVNERKVDKAQLSDSKTVRNVVATCDGVILSNTVINGTALCKVGQAVTEGQTLVSGYTDCGIVIKAACAEAEILAQTKHFQEVIAPSIYQKRMDVLKCEKRYSVQVGKKLIKLYKGSGISDASCVKIYKRNYISLPGGFRVPVCFLTERMIQYATAEQSKTQYTFVENYSAAYLHSHMISGQIIDTETSYKEEEGVVRLKAEYACTEMIGQTETEERINVYGFYN